MNRTRGYERAAVRIARDEHALWETDDDNGLTENLRRRE